ncbi:MAG: Hsp20/alpha crystallin family protein, partial [bacterium]
VQCLKAPLRTIGTMDIKLFDELFRMQNDVIRFVDHLQHLSKIPAGFSTMPWIPQANIYEKDEAYIILAELPGIDPQKMQVSVRENLVVIQGEKRPPAAVQNTRCRHMEISFGPFVRSLQLSEPLDSEGVQAHYHHGLLEIIVPKRRSGNLKREIPIQSQD